MGDLISFIKPYLPIKGYSKFNTVQNSDNFLTQLNPDLIFRTMIALKILNSHYHFQAPFHRIQDQNSLLQTKKK